MSWASKTICGQTVPTGWATHLSGAPRGAAQVCRHRLPGVATCAVIAAQPSQRHHPSSCGFLAAPCPCPCCTGAPGSPGGGGGGGGIVSFVNCAAPVHPDPGEGRCSKLWKKAQGARVHVRLHIWQTGVRVCLCLTSAQQPAFGGEKWEVETTQSSREKDKASLIPLPKQSLGMYLLIISPFSYSLLGLELEGQMHSLGRLPDPCLTKWGSSTIAYTTGRALQPLSVSLAALKTDFP